MYFQLFGTDIYVNNKLEPLLMEINKGPYRFYKYEREKKSKMKKIQKKHKIPKKLDLGCCGAP